MIHVGSKFTNWGQGFSCGPRPSTIISLVSLGSKFEGELMAYNAQQDFNALVFKDKQ